MKIGQLVMAKAVLERNQIYGLRSGSIGEVVAPGILTLEGNVNVKFRGAVRPSGRDTWQTPPSNLIPIGGPDIDLGEDTYMEFDTKAKKPVKESA